MIGLDWAARLLLAPILVAQALAVRSRAQRLPEPAGPRSGLSGTGPPLRLLILGDSSAAGVGAASQNEALSGRLVRALADRASVAWTLRAATGATTRDGLHWLEAMDGATFDIAVTAFGVNDVTRGVPLPVWLRRQRALAGTLRERFGVAHVYMSGMPPLGNFPLLPQPLRWVLGRQAARFARGQARLGGPGLRILPFDQTLDVKDMAADGFHPGPKIYAAWADRLAAAIRADLR